MRITRGVTCPSIQEKPILGGGYPSSVLAGGGGVGHHPSPVLFGTGIPSPAWDWGTYPCLRLGHPPGKDLGPETWERNCDWGTPWEGTWNQSLEYSWKGHGTSGWKCYGMEMGYPLSHLKRQAPVPSYYVCAQERCKLSR